MTDNIQQFDHAVNLLQTILWEYDKAPNIKALLEAKQAWYDVNQKGFWEDFYTDIFDLRTANQFGLQVWSIILGQPIFINSRRNTKPTWGFGQYYKNFTRGNFSTTSGFSSPLPIETARVVLRLRYYQLTGSGTVPEINRILNDVFASYGKAYLIDNHDMSQTYIFQFALPSDLQYVFNNFDVLPRPAGVSSSYNVILGKSWGFDSNIHENFDNGNFLGT